MIQRNFSQDLGALKDYTGHMPPQIAVAIADNVRRLRKATRISQAELARRAGVHVNTIRFLESGRVENVRVDTLEAISKAMSVDIAELVRCSAKRADSAACVAAFLSSPYAAIAKPTDDEREWLEGVPVIEWLGGDAPPDAEAIYYLLLAHRATPDV